MPRPLPVCSLLDGCRVSSHECCQKKSNFLYMKALLTNCVFFLYFVVIFTGGTPSPFKDIQPRSCFTSIRCRSRGDCRCWRVFCKYSCPLSGYKSLQNRPPESGTPCVLHSDCGPVQIVMLNYIIYRFFVLYLPKVASVLDTSISPNRFEHGYSNPETNPESASFSWVSVFARYVIHRWFGPISHVLPFVF